MNKEIETLRQSIDVIEDKLISLLNERAKCAIEIGKIKRTEILPIVDKNREELILNRVAKKNMGPLSNKFMQDIFKRIIEESVVMESE
ncbi:MAG: chorismate mutase [Fibromonadaceae bacterium]|jgi:chorismate mutase|nr:chorismate mutase [Fibromonadaceae bacterium]